MPRVHEALGLNVCDSMSESRPSRFLQKAGTSRSCVSTAIGIAEVLAND
jgi:hypothetical protein